MRSVPAFVMSCHPRREVRFALGVLAGLSMGVGTWWAARHLSLHDAPSVACAVAAASLAALVAWRSPAREVAVLRWNGAQWLLGDGQGRDGGNPGHAGRVAVRIDIAGWMLLHFRSDDRSIERWLTVAQSGSPEVWHALRCALYAPPAPAPVRSRAGGVSAGMHHDDA